MPKLKRNSARAAKPTPQRAPGSLLDELTDSEVRLLRDVTLNQASVAESPLEQELLGAFWWQMEKEYQRRTVNVTFLERLYFSS